MSISELDGDALNQVSGGKLADQSSTLLEGLGRTAAGVFTSTLSAGSIAVNAVLGGASNQLVQSAHEAALANNPTCRPA